MKKKKEHANTVKRSGVGGIHQKGIQTEGSIAAKTVEWPTTAGNTGGRNDITPTIQKKIRNR